MREPGTLDPGRVALLTYDMTQNRFTPGERRYSKAAADGLADLVRLVETCRRTSVPVCYAVSVRAAPDFDVCHAIAPKAGDKVVVHTKTGAFFGTDLQQFLQDEGRDVLMLSGIALDYGVSSTAREALTLGIHPVLVRDACFSYDIPQTPVGTVSREDLERAHLASLYFMGASITSIDEIIPSLQAVPPPS